MLFTPKKAGNTTLTGADLTEDRRHLQKIGPAGIGEKALYLNSFYISRFYYIAWQDVRRVYKRVSMTKGGFTGKGMFSTMPYLIVEKNDGTEQKCNFKVEDEVDAILEAIEELHPEIPTHSFQAEQKLAEARREEEARYVKDLPDRAKNTIAQLEDARDFLKKDDRWYRLLVYTAKEKRSVDGISAGAKGLAIGMAIGSAVAILAGLGLYFLKGWKPGIYLALLGGAFLITSAASRALPTPSRNKKSVQKDWDEALHRMTLYLQDRSNFPVPPQYAHPIVLERMIRTIKEGRAVTAAEALDVVKEDLRALNSGVTVTQQEHDEVVTVKPMFLVCEYK